MNRLSHIYRNVQLTTGRLNREKQGLVAMAKRTKKKTAPRVYRNNAGQLLKAGTATDSHREGVRSEAGDGRYRKNHGLRSRLRRAPCEPSLQQIEHLPAAPPLLDGTAEHTKAAAAAPARMNVPAAVRRTAVDGEGVPATAPVHPDQGVATSLEARSQLAS